MMHRCHGELSRVKNGGASHIAVVGDWNNRRDFPKSRHLTHLLVVSPRSNCLLIKSFLCALKIGRLGEKKSSVGFTTVRKPGVYLLLELIKNTVL